MIRPVGRFLWLAFAALVIAAAIVLTAARLLFPLLDVYRGEVEAQVADAVGQPVRIGALDARWRGLRPEIVLHDVQLLDKDGASAVGAFAELDIELDLVDSLLNGRIALGRLTVVVSSFLLIRDEQGALALSGVDSGGAPADAAQGNLLAAWLLRQGLLGVEIRELHFLDQYVGGRVMSFTDVSLDLRNLGERHQLAGSLQLPAVLGHSARIAADIYGDPLRADGWSGELYLETSAFNLGYWLREHALQGAVLRQGLVSAQLWGRWDDARLSQLEGSVGLFDVEVADAQAAAASVRLDRASGWFTWERTERGWRLQGDELGFQREGSTWPDSRFTASYQAGDAPGQLDLDLQASFLRIEDLAALALAYPQLDPAARKALEGMRPRGDLRELHLQYQPGEPHNPLALHGLFNGLSIQAWRQLPGVTGLAGVLRADNRSGRVELNTFNASVWLPELFRSRLSLTGLRGRIDWRELAGGWRLSVPGLEVASPDIRGQASLELLLPADGSSPFIDLAVAFRDGDGSKVSRYLPVGRMPEKVVDWLDQGILDGRVRSGGMVLHGRAADFPYLDGQGRFEVAFDVEDAVLVPESEWPQISEIDAQVRFFGAAMEISASDGRIFDSRIPRAVVRIPSMRAKPPELQVVGEVVGSTPEKLRYLRESPLRAKFQDVIEPLRAQGHSRLTLDLRLPLAAGEAARVAGTVLLQDNRLHVGYTDMDIERINGTLGFSDAGLSAERLSGELFGKPVSVRIYTEQAEPAALTVLEAQLLVDPRSFAAHYRQPLLERLIGQSPWQLALFIPQRRTATGPGVRLRLESQLEGTLVALPSPLAKSADERRKLMVRADFSDPRFTLWQADFGAVLSGVIEWQAGARDVSALRAELRLGGETPVLPDQRGLRLVGALPYLSVSAWQQALGQVQAQAQPAQDSPDGLGWLHSVDLRADLFEIFGQELHQFSVQGRRIDREWLASLQAREIAGRLVLPLDWSADTLVLELDHWRIAPPPQQPEGQARKDGKRIDPRRLPALRISSERFGYDQLDLGRLDLVAERRDDGLQVRRLALTSPEIKIEGGGSWTGTELEQATELALRLDSNDVGRSLAALGYAGSIKEGQGSVEGRARWPAGPADFSFEHLGGSLRMDIRNGRLLEIEPGAGRVFGLLSLQTLPRRLSLDFSDLFKKGFTFDRIKGDFTITEGVASTDNLWMSSPSARIDVAGTVDLANRRYDQRALVTPHVSENLPLLGALAASPQIGALIFLAQKLFKKQLDKLTQFEYAITGPWDQPEVKQVAARRARQEAAAE